ncbi:DoxX family protein [Aestuariivirga sp.]|uniref:DoxX family protein n=1 Tax=Aestuariivirga sp. TaxID=2650926 RepID=UPI003593C569
MNRLFDLAELAGRLLLAALFLFDGWVVVNDYSGTAEFLTANGVPAVMLPAALLTQVGGGILVALGFMTRLAALALGGFCLMTALLFHASSDPNEQIQFFKDLAIAGGFFVLMAHGAGRYSIDERWRRRRT